jgi:hypothetical protein
MFSIFNKRYNYFILQNEYIIILDIVWKYVDI